MINFGIKSYKEIVNFINKNNFDDKKINEKKKIVIHCVDFLNNNEDENIFIKRLFKDKFEFEFNNTNPDYLLYDVYGCNHLDKKYNNAIKIAYLSENIIPDFNEADYAISQANINYLDRYFKYPIFIYYLAKIKNKNFDYIRKATLKYKRKKKFCAAVISNNISTDYFRINFIEKLNKYKKIDMGGKVNNNIGGSIKNKIKFLSSYKFSISMENSEGDGYISEKIIDSILAGTIPIYYGNYMIDEFINPKVYILIKGKRDIIKKIEYIKKIDNDYNLYKNFLTEKILIDDKLVNKIENEKKNFFYHIFAQKKIQEKELIIII